MTIRRGFFPASFDPLTNGHHDLILRSLSFCDELYLGIGKNPTKKINNQFKKLKIII